MNKGRFKVFVTRRIPSAGLDKILAECDAEVWDEPLPVPRETLLKEVVGCHGLLTLLTEKIDAEVMEVAGDQLRVVSNFAVGYNNIDISQASRRGIRVGNTPDVLTDATADIAMALLLTAARRVIQGYDFIRQGHWKTWEPLGHIGMDLSGKTIGIVGMGRIGQAVARRCHGGWGMRVLYTSRSEKGEINQELGAKRVNLDELLRESDFVSVHTSMNDETHGMFDASAFGKMKNTAIFINTGRGPLHNQHDLYEALQSGEIFAAGLDVTDPEPIEMGDPLLKLSNCVITPHIGSATVSSRDGMAEIAADNLLLGMRGESLRCCVNPS